MEELQITDMELPHAAAKRAGKKKRRPFQARWARIPAAWRARLRKTRSATAANLAITILFEAFRSEQQWGTDIVLSAHVTGLERRSRKRGIEELIRLGLIRVRRRNERCAFRVDLLLY